MINKDDALNQINEINKVIQGDLAVLIPGKLMMAIGAAIIAIPCIETIFSVTIDPLLNAVHASFSMIFILRTIFYWTLFTCIDKYISPKREQMHPVIKKAWERQKFFPIISVATAAALAITGHGELICPIILILVGCLFALFGQFTPFIVTAVACSYIIGGIIGIYISTLPIPHLWMYLVSYLGLGLILMGLILHYQQRSKTL